MYAVPLDEEGHGQLPVLVGPGIAGGDAEDRIDEQPGFARDAGCGQDGGRSQAPGGEDDEVGRDERGARPCRTRTPTASLPRISTRSTRGPVFSPAPRPWASPGMRGCPI